MLDPGKASVFTPHPLQFVSPKLAKSPVKATETSAPPPKKPQRVFSEPPITTPEEPAEKPIIVKPAEQSDTASRRYVIIRQRQIFGKVYKKNFVVIQVYG